MPRAGRLSWRTNRCILPRSPLLSCRKRLLPCRCPLSRYKKNCIATHPGGQAARAHYRLPLRANRPCRSAADRVAPPGARPALLCHDTICCIVTQHQKWAVAHPVVSSAPFFFFFICSTHCKTTKFFFFFKSSSRTS